MKNILSQDKILKLIAISLTLASCTHGFQQNKPLHTDTIQKALKNDTLIVDKWAAVFVEPDSLRIEKRKKEIGEEDFYIVADDYLFYMYKSHKFLDSVKLPIITTNGEKYIKFVYHDKQQQIIQLDTIPELWNIYLFEPKSKAKKIDMTTIEEEYKNYLKTANGN